jgi:hypothetical protein
MSANVKESTYGMPDPTASKAEKGTDEYGLKYANFIYSQHRKNLDLYTSQRENDIINRKYREGMQSVQNMKNRLDIDGDSSYLNLDLSPITRIASIVDNIKGKLINMPINIQCNPIDSEAQSKFDKYKKEMYADMFLKKHAEEISKMTGIPATPYGKEIPATTDEANLMFSTFRLDESIAMEQALSWVMGENDLDEKVRNTIIEDLITIKRAAIYTYYDDDWNIRVEAMDPIDIITPYSKYDDFRNITWVGILKQYQLWEIAEMNPKFTEKDLWQIAKEYQGKYKNAINLNLGESYEGYYQSNNGARPYMDFNIEVMEFFYMTPSTEVREIKKNSKGGTFYNTKSSSYNKETTDKKEVLKRKMECLYKGKWITGSKHLWGYKRVDNEVRDKLPDGSFSPEVIMPICIIAPGIRDMENKSIVERLRSLEDQWNLTYQKYQQVLIKAVPPGVKFDVASLDGIILKKGADADPLEILKMYLQTGSFPYSSVDKDGRYINSSGVEQLAPNISGTIQAYIMTQQHIMQLMNDVIGFNSAVDASSPNKDALVGVQKMAAQATQNALRPIYNAHANLIKKAAKTSVLMIQDCLEHNYKAFTTSLGPYATKILSIGKDLPLNSFGIEIELLPDDEEKIQIEGLIELGLKTGSLNSSDAIRVRQEMKQNTKRAAQLLMTLEKKNRDDAQAAKNQDIQNNGQVQQQSIIAKSQADERLIDVKTKAEIEKIRAEEEEKRKTIALQGKIDAEIQILKNQGTESGAKISASGKAITQQVANEGKRDTEAIKQQSKKKESETA